MEIREIFKTRRETWGGAQFQFYFRVGGSGGGTAPPGPLSATGLPYLSFYKKKPKPETHIFFFCSKEA
jgi:hypothetical protein